MVEWLNGASSEKKQIHLGFSHETDVQSRLEKIGLAIAQTTEQTFGLCDVCHEDVNTELLEMDFTASVCIDHLSNEQKRRLEQDLELSHKVQKALLPREPPAIPGLQLAAFIQHAEIVGGDYYDFFRFRDGTYGLAIADVMGKGLPASMLVASLQASLRILVPENESPLAVMRRLNSLFCHNIHLIRFISIVLARYDPASRVLEYSNAGHNPAIHLRAADIASPVLLKPTGPAIGLTESAEYSTTPSCCSQGDQLLLYTDGVTEARNHVHEEFGESRLTDWAMAHSDAEPSLLIDGLRRTLHAFHRNDNAAR